MGFLKNSVGTLLAGLGVFLLTWGIVTTVREAAAIEDDAVARGATGTPVSFESREPKLAVYLNADFSVSDREDRFVRATSCTVTADGGYEHSFSGSRQGSSTTFGDWASVGSFTLPGTSGTVDCTTNASRLVPDQIPFVVTPHDPGESFRSIGAIILGAFVGGGGLMLAFRGVSRRRREPSGPQSFGP